MVCRVMLSCSIVLPITNWKPDILPSAYFATILLFHCGLGLVLLGEDLGDYLVVVGVWHEESLKWKMVANESGDVKLDLTTVLDMR